MLLEYKNLRIRNATTTDAVILTNWWNDGAIMAHVGFPKGIGENLLKYVTGLIVRRIRL